MNGVFFTFEGIDGSGKTTQINKLNSYLKSLGLSTLVTREPGGTKIGDKIRSLLLDTANKGMNFKTETLLFQASRAELVEKIIRPALKNGKIVLCDRFYDSTIVYQGIARGLGMRRILDMSMWASGEIEPDKTFLFSLNVKTSEKRLDGQVKKRDRIESQEKEFKEKIQNGYLDIAKIFKNRFVIIDAEMKFEDVFEIVKENTLRILKSRGIIDR